MPSRRKKATNRKLVVLKGLPSGFLNGLLPEDQKAISSVVGKPVQLIGYDKYRRAELKFLDIDGDSHFIYVHPRFISAAKPQRARQPIPLSSRTRKRPTTS